jgi:hypothetical protein
MVHKFSSLIDSFFLSLSLTVDNELDKWQRTIRFSIGLQEKEKVREEENEKEEEDRMCGGVRLCRRCHHL